MRFTQAYVRNIQVGDVSDADLGALATALSQESVEVVCTAHGAYHGACRLAVGRRSAPMLARRNIRSLLTRNPSADEVGRALGIALTAAPRDAEAALYDAGVEFNLRYSIFATVDATIQFKANELILRDAEAATERILCTELRENGRQYFCDEALARLIGLDLQAVRFAPSAVAPLALQRTPGAIMPPDTAQAYLHKGDWRATRKPDFVKDHCIACARCFVQCPDDAIVHSMFDRNARDATGVLGIDYERCTACGICAAVCPTDRNGYKAIVMVDARSEVHPEVHRVT